MSLGDVVVAVTDAHSFDNLTMTKEFQLKPKKMKKSSINKLAVAGHPGEQAKVDAPPKDVHFYFRSTTPTSACPKGRSTIITMRCDIDDNTLKGVNGLSVNLVLVFIAHSVFLSFLLTSCLIFIFSYSRNGTLFSPGELSLPPKCADGTCDGCNFNILWKTGAACPICAEEDFKQIRGECKDSQQTIHYMAPDTCRYTDGEKTRVSHHSSYKFL